MEVTSEGATSVISSPEIRLAQTGTPESAGRRNGTQKYNRTVTWALQLQLSRFEHQGGFCTYQPGVWAQIYVITNKKNRKVPDVYHAEVMDNVPSLYLAPVRWSVCVFVCVSDGFSRVGGDNCRTLWQEQGTGHSTASWWHGNQRAPPLLSAQGPDLLSFRRPGRHQKRGSYQQRPCQHLAASSTY